MKIGILGGTGFGPLIEKAGAIRVETPWGEIDVGHLREGNADLFLVERHGRAHLPPHRIVHRANVDALARCGVDAILALNTVGGVDPTLAAPSLLVPDDLIDLRRTTETFHDTRAVHVDVTRPYCPTLRSLLLRQAPHARDGGVYAAVDGPRLETRAEIRMLRTMGASVVGMTGCPEATLARERALCYAALSLVVNPAAGVRDEPLNALAIKQGAETMAPEAMRVVLAAARDVQHERGCSCRAALDGARF